MDFLPKIHTEFSEKQYWDKFFVKRGSDAFEWYGEYPQLCLVLHKYLKPSDNTLVVGCGNSKLSPGLYDDGYQNICNVDISSVVIKRMNDQHSDLRPKMTWKTMDVLQMTFDDEQFNAVVDKGTLDALMTEDTPEVLKEASQMFSEIGRVLKTGGRYICVSLLQAHILQLVINWFSEEGWMVRFHRCPDAEIAAELENPDRVIFPVFVIICTKLKKMPNMPQVLEICLGNTEKAERVANASVVMEAVQALQQYAFVRYNLYRSNQKQEIFLELFHPGCEQSRYCLYVVDNTKRARTKFAIFIVPEGRETEWLFGSPEGRRHLAEGSSCQRLIVVHLSRDHVYEDLEAVKGELSSRVLELAPSDLSPLIQVPFWSVGGDLGKREVIQQGTSTFSGDFVVEDVVGENLEIFRRLVFLANRNVVQSEARLRLVGTKKKGKKKLVADHAFLACDHHKLMVSGLAFLPQLPTGDAHTAVLIIGLGGGGLPMFLHRHFTKVRTEVVDIDPEMVNVATISFGFIQDNRMIIHIADGCEFLSKAANTEEGKKYHVIMLDVDCKDMSIGMSCPPQQFVEMETLQNIRSLLHPDGLLIVNLVCRNTQLKQKVTADLSHVFSVLFSIQVEDEVNEIVYCLCNTESGRNIPPHITERLETLSKQVRQSSNGSAALDIEFASKLQIR